MAEETTSTTSDQQLSQIINQLLAGKTAQPAVDPNTGPSSREGRGILSLLGEGLGGGAQYGSTQEREQGGLSALGALGSRMLQASDWSVMPHTFGSILGQGLDAARGNLGHTQAVSAARQYAAQEQAHQAQQDQIARLKEALPYLQLMQNREAIKGMPGSLLGGGGSNTSIGTAGDYTVPAELLPAYKAAAEKYGVPVELLIAQHKQESNLNPGATGGAGEVGLGQILPATAKSPGFGMVGADLKALRDPATNIDFSAQYLAARAKAAGADLKTPEGIQKALRAYNGGGDPNYVQNVLRYVPGAQKALTGGAPAVAPGQAPAPKAGGLPVAPEPPLATTAPGQTAQGPEEGTVQVAGGGASTSGVIPTLPPAAAARSAADVADIQAGMANAQATPLVRQPGAVVTAQAGGQPPDPNSFEAYRLAHPIAPPAPEQRMLFDAGLTPEQQKAHDTQLKALEVQYQAARAKGDPTAAAAAQEKLVTLETATSTLRENARKLAVEKQAEYYKDQDKQRFDAWTAQQAQRNKQAEADQKLQNDLVLKDKEGEISRLNTREGSFVESNKIIRDTLGKEAVAAAGKMQSLEGLRALSDNVGDNNATLQSLANIKYGGTTLLNHLTNAGIVGKGDAGPIQMLQSGISGAITELRAGIQMGALSDRDLSFIESMGPSLYEDRATRSAVISYLQQAARAKMRFNTIYNEQMARPNANSGDALEKTREIMDTKHPIVPQMPADIYAHRRDPDPAWQAKVAEWAQENNVKPRTLYRAPGGGLKLVPDPGTPGGG